MTPSGTVTLTQVVQFRLKCPNMLCVNTLRWSDIWLKNGTLDRPYLLTIFPPKYPFPSPQSSRNIVLLNIFFGSSYTSTVFRIQCTCEQGICPGKIFGDQLTVWGEPWLWGPFLRKHTVTLFIFLNFVILVCIFPYSGFGDATCVGVSLGAAAS